MGDLDFISDTDLRARLENSIEYIYTLYEQTKAPDQKQLFKEETYRVIILYVISAIEAILLYFYKKRDEKIEYNEYKFASSLPEEFIHTEKNGFPVVVAVQIKNEKKEFEIGLNDLVTLFKNKKLILDNTANDILELNDIRNTFHFNKPRDNNCDIVHVESALKLLVYTIQRAPLALRGK